MAMDALRVAYAVPMKLYRDSDDTVMIRWYPCRPGAKLFPHRHAMGSLYWDTYREAGGFPLGEVTLNRAERPWRSNRFPDAPAGQEFHGDPDWFLHGAPVDAPRFPPCGPPPPPDTWCILKEDGGELLKEDLTGCIEIEHS